MLITALSLALRAVITFAALSLAATILVAGECVDKRHRKGVFA